jgi:hypothetical protein
MGIPIIADDSVPTNKVFMLPPDVTQAINYVQEVGTSACIAVVACFFSPWLFPDPRTWPLVHAELLKITDRKRRAFQYAEASATLTIKAAALEKRIGVITTIG